MVSPTQLCWRYHSLPLSRWLMLYTFVWICSISSVFCHVLFNINAWNDLNTSKSCIYQSSRVLIIVKIHYNMMQSTKYCINSLRPSDAVWNQELPVYVLSTLLQLMACYLKAASHYQNPCWNINNEVMWPSLGGSSAGIVHDINH